MNSLLSFLPADPELRAACEAFAIPERVPASAEEVAFLATGRRTSLTLDRQEVAYWTFGDGPRVLLMHGWCSRGSHLAGFVAPLLAAGRSVVLFDAPGHGDSDGAASSMIHTARCALSLAQAGGGFEALIAHSAGSTAALWALANGLSVQKSVHLCGPSSMKQVVTGTARAQGLEQGLALRFEAWVETFTGVDLDSTTLSSLTANLHHAGLIIHDSSDRVVDLSQSRALQAAWPEARLQVTEGLGHRRILGDARTIASAVAFLAGEA
ncbi:MULTISPECIES: alpha/beta fold hydrolase [unclassified Pseudomonas]|uniref:alpha/beta fold hydrolase n=1 Tax=unclassified Pseudomonas TaxID=196821 RepID=UPI000D338E8B|nr:MULTISPECIES: alpha/beta fold hydrolase [unclassified Pseudomonas]RAU44115.1 alpha/beta fold hydrolase [Pseudomonas sp. RIT 409]RAU54860.1 alpha/beta fold hydrolase [Pseudomonas sp. RIT 412]